MSRGLCVAAAVVAAACSAAGNDLGRRPPARVAAPEALLARARAFSTRGDHVRAAAYCEASLDAGGDERRILPLLVGSLVRAGELRRALPPISRMRALWPDDTALPLLERTIDALLVDPGRARGRWAPR